MKKVWILLTVSAFAWSSCQKHADNKQPLGLWLGQMQLNDTTSLPFEVSFEKNGDSIRARYINGEERIASRYATQRQDSLVFEHSVFNTSVVIWPDQNGWKGYFEDMEKQDTYRIPLVLIKHEGERFENKGSLSSKSEGLWNVHFGNSLTGIFPATGIFYIEKNEFRGTFLTETGDYRFLSGTSNEDKLYLSGFDGLHAFLVKAKISEDSIKGEFWSGMHYFRTFKGVKADSSFLRDPYSLTQIKEVNDYFPLQVLSPENLTQRIPSILKRGPAVVQIMGTWCPNCMDESRYLNDIRKKYADKGLKVIGIAFEKGGNVQEALKKIEKARFALGLNYPIYYADEPKKENVLAWFPFMSDMKSYPTTVYLNKSLKPVKIHTGFSGPGTGTFFDTFVVENDSFINSLLKEI